MSSNLSKRRNIIPCATSACSSAGSIRDEILYDDDDESHLYSPPSPSECQKFHMPDPVQQTVSEGIKLFERRKSGPKPPIYRDSTQSLNSMPGAIQPNRRSVPEPRDVTIRPSTGVFSMRRRAQSPAGSRVSTGVSNKSSSTSSEDYSISLPSTNRTSTTSSRHINNMGDEGSRAASRQSVMTTTSNHSILDARQIQVYLKKCDSQISLASTQTMSQLTLDDDKQSPSTSASSSSSNGNKLSPKFDFDPECEMPSRSHSIDAHRKKAQIRSLNMLPSYHLQTGSEAIWRSASHSPDGDGRTRPRSQYIGELVWQLDNVVYVGSIQAAQNLNLLCRLKIEYIVDLCGEEAETVSRFVRPRPECPCLCTRKTAHSRMTMTINLRDDSEPHNKVDLSDAQRQDIITYFGDLIHLIQKARISGKCVLIHSMKGRNRGPAFAAAYLMYSQRCTRVQALSQMSVLMSKTRPGLAVSDNFLRALNHWQNLLNIKSNESTLNNNSATVFQIKKTAWNEK
ncbi:Tyrosine-protein phosphatase domain-containing protein [Aphelenchoides bicaudatus]|nr:Tyrosine-protein phosphatase domain-containing protein [Aphelenchoides bicaudatus]